MRTIIFISILTISTAKSQTPVIYNLPDANLTSNVICGKDRVCDPGPYNTGAIYRFSDHPYSPDIDDTSTPASIASSILGSAVLFDGGRESEERNVCSVDGYTSRITVEDVTPKGSYGTQGRKFTYDKTKKTEINLTASADANILDIRKECSLDDNYIKDLRAKLEAKYKSVNNIDLLVEANYSEWSLKEPIWQKMKNALDWADCRAILKEKKWAIITDIALITYNISFNGKKIRELGIDITAELKAKGINVDVGALLEKEISKNLTAQTVNAYQVIGWRKRKAGW